MIGLLSPPFIQAVSRGISAALEVIIARGRPKGNHFTRRGEKKPGCAAAGQGNSERVVYFDARTKIHLLNYLESRTDDDPALFVSLTKPHKCLMIGGVEARLWRRRRQPRRKPANRPRKEKSSANRVAFFSLFA